MKWITWDQAAIAALASWILSLALRRARPTKLGTIVLPAAREVAFISSVYSIWRLARQLPIANEEGAVERAHQIARLQDWLHIPSELTLQRFVIDHDRLAQFTNWYYAAFHVPGLIIFMVWLFARHREVYQRWRTALALLTAFCLIIRFVRVAPPRFLGDLGFIDLGTRYGISVYGSVGSGLSDQYAAMPSIHVAWAAVVSFGVFVATTSRWRWFFLLHVVLTTLVVSATGHHWWMDGIVAIGLLAISLRIDTVGRRWGADRRAKQVVVRRNKIGVADEDDQRSVVF